MRALDEKALGDFEGFIQQHVPGFEVRFKDESAVMALLGFLSTPFNADFMEKYTTTWGKRVYFPDEGFYLKIPAKSLRILAHEFVHLWDSKRHPLTFKLSYILPQLFVLLPLIAYAVLAWPHPWIALLPFVSYVLACAAAKLSRVLFWIALPLLLGGTGVLAWWLTGWWALVLSGAIVFLVPWPAYWRTKWEIRGYGMNVAMAWWFYNAFSVDYVERITQRFTGPAYFFMWWSGTRVRTAMTGFHELAKSGELQNDTQEPYGLVYDFLQDES